MKATNKFTNEIKNIRVSSLTIDTSKYEPEWDEFAGQYLCPVICIPAYFVSAAIWEIVNGEQTITSAKINGVWFKVHSHGGRIGTHRSPHLYPNTKVKEILTTNKLSEYFKNITNK